MTQAHYRAETYRMESSVGWMLHQVRSAVTDAFNAQLEPLGITLPQWRILMRVYHGLGATAAELCRHTEYDTGSMTRMLARMEKRNLIRRTRHAGDKRLITIELTNDSLALIPDMVTAVVKVHNQFLRDFTSAEVATLSHLLQRILANSPLEQD